MKPWDALHAHPFHHFSELVPERASVVHPKTTSVLRKHEHHDDDDDDDGDDEDEDEDEDEHEDEDEVWWWNLVAIG